MSIPSRYDNPFATCWTRPGAMPFRFPPGESAARVIDRLAAQGWRGEIVGPHGSGKSTLLATLLPQIEATGRAVHAVALHDGERRLPNGFQSKVFGSLSLWSESRLGDERAGMRGNIIVVVDGYEQLAPWRRWWLRQKCRRAGAGLLVTAHEPTGLPPLVALAPDLALIEQLVGALSERRATPIAQCDIAASHACHGSNVREILFDLYDRHEQRIRAARTLTACRT